MPPRKWERRYTGVKRPRDDNPPAAAAEAVVDPLVARGRELLGLEQSDNDQWCLTRPMCDGSTSMTYGPCDHSMLMDALYSFCRVDQKEPDQAVTCVLAALRWHGFDWNALVPLHQSSKFTSTPFALLFGSVHGAQMVQLVQQLTPDDIDWPGVCRGGPSGTETYLEYLLDDGDFEEGAIDVCRAFIRTAPVACFVGSTLPRVTSRLTRTRYAATQHVVSLLEALFLRSVASGLAFDVNDYSPKLTLHDIADDEYQEKEVSGAVRTGHAATYAVSRLMTTEVAKSVQTSVPELIPDLAALVASYTALIGPLSRRTKPTSS
jgi:hypothetical protein